MTSWLSFPAGRRAKFAVLALWVVLLALAVPLSGRLDSLLREDPESYLPRGAESVEAIGRLEGFPLGATLPAVVVFSREYALTPEDRAVVEQLRVDLNSDPPAATQEVGPPRFSGDSTTALLFAPIRAADDVGALSAAVTDIRGKRWTRRLPTPEGSRPR